jgi:iron(III) transport system substrate-binding protein
LPATVPSRRPARALALVATLGLALAACAGTAQPTSSPAGATPTGSTPSAQAPSDPSASGPPAGALTIYSGRSEELVGPLIERFEAESGIDVEVNYAGTSELAATILEEGDASPADVFFSQDAGALGALAAEGRLANLPPAVLDLVEARFRSDDGQWVGVSGRARVAAYDTRVLSEADLPDSVLGFADPAWKGKLGWAPSNASFQSFVTALRVLAGEDAARAWLEGVHANDPAVYEGNSQALEGVATGETQVALINHYYLLEAIAERGELPVANYFFPAGDPGALVNVAGAGVLTTARNAPAALAFIEFLLDEESQRYFAETTFEYPLIAGVSADQRLTPLTKIESPEIDLSDLADLEGTLRLMQETGVL